MNYEKLLDKCELQGTSLETIKGRLGRVNYSTAEKVGALFEYQLRVISGELKPKERTSMPLHCGDEFCDRITRTYPEYSLDRKGVRTNKCLKCHPDYFESKKQEKTEENFELEELLTHVFREVD